MFTDTPTLNDDELAELDRRYPAPTEPVRLGIR